VEHDVHNDDDRSAWGANSKEQFNYFERLDVERFDVEQPALAARRDVPEAPGRQHIT
jgi:hypothetical protein